MAEFERFLEDHRSELDMDRPRNGHEDRFRQRLLDHTGKSFRLRHALQVAASVAILVTSGIVLVRMNKSGEKQAQRVIPETVLEADTYYTSQMNAKYEQIESFSFENAEEKTVLLDELRDLEVTQQQLMEDLEAHPDDERVINALIRHYQIKLEVMDQIIRQLNQIKNEISEEDENANV